MAEKRMLDMAGARRAGPTEEAERFLAVMLATRGWDRAPHRLMGSRASLRDAGTGASRGPGAGGRRGVVAAALRVHGSAHVLLVFRPDGPEGGCMFAREADLQAAEDAGDGPLRGNGVDEPSGTGESGNGAEKVGGIGA